MYICIASIKGMEIHILLYEYDGNEDLYVNGQKSVMFLQKI